MATAEEILATMADDTSEYEDFCLIDTDARTISISEKLKIVGVESDEDVVRRTFRMPWKVGENDLSTFAIRINYLNAQGEGDIYIVDDMQKSGDDMTFSWLLSRYATKYRGSIRFVVCMILFDGSEIDKEWNTTLAEFTVLEGLETSSQIEEDNPDAIENILLRLNKLESTGGVSDEQIGNAVNDYLTKNPIQPGATQEQAEQIEANKKAIEELQQNGAGGGITEETDPTVPAWAKSDTKPKYTADEVGALPNTTVIPTVPNALKNPYPLTINGVAYDGSEAKTINIQASGGGESVSLDTTLTQYGMAADAGAVGNALAQEKDAREEELNELKESIVDEVHVGKTEPTDPNVKVWINPEGEATIPGGTVEVDTTLTKSGMAADAKVTGDLLNSLNEEIEALKAGGGSAAVTQKQEKPLVYIDGTIPTTKDNVLATMTVKSSWLNFFAYIKIKCQGTSSMAHPKKNFTVTLYQDEERSIPLYITIPGWKHPSYKFVLKANYIDRTHARNVVNARLWGEIVASRQDYDSLPEELRNSPNNGAVDGFPILVTTNGSYQGIYTWNIGKDAWMWGMDEDNLNHALMCAETNTDGEYAETPCNFRALWSGVHEEDWSVEVGTNSDTLKNSLNALISCVKDTTDEEFVAQIGTYLDIQSAIDYYIFAFADCGIDGLAKNMLLGTYDMTLWHCGAYDLDTTWGLYWYGSPTVPANRVCPDEYQEQFSMLWERITTLYADRLKERYWELRSSVLSYANIVSHFERFADEIGEKAYADDVIPYPDIPGKDDNNIWHIRNFVRDRLVYCDNQMSEHKTMYELAAPHVFSGTIDDAINTNVKLWEKDRDFTIAVDLTPNAQTARADVVWLHDSVEPWPGFDISVYSPTDTYSIGINGDGGKSVFFTSIPGTSTNRMAVVVTHAKGSNIYNVALRINGATQTKVLEGPMSPSVSVNMWLGCADGDWTPARPWNGTMNRFGIYERVMTEAEITAYLAEID